MVVPPVNITYNREMRILMNTRIEKDSLGDVAVPEEAYWGAQTQRAFLNFDIGDETFPPTFIRALAIIKHAAATVNAELGGITTQIADLICRAADEVVDGNLSDQFPLRIWQTGSGTQTHMNINEVIANRANELAGGTRGKKSPVHPNDHVNRSQSTNDVFPTAIHIAVVAQCVERMLPAAASLQNVLEEKAREFAEIVKTGRTHLMDATPLTLGQVFSGYAHQVAHGQEAIKNTLDHLYELPIGGTAVGTGLNTHLDYADKVTARIAERTGHPFVSAPNKFEALGARDALVSVSGAIKRLACALYKIANDIRLLGSGPRCGIGELILPENEPGSSIMPGKVNPTQCEAMTMVCAQVIGNDTTISLAGAAGNFELNVFMPVIAFNSLQSVRLLADACDAFREHCVVGIRANTSIIAEYLDSSLMLVTALTPKIGYDVAAKLAQKAHREGSTLREVAVEEGVLSAEEFDALVVPSEMVSPNLS